MRALVGTTAVKVVARGNATTPVIQNLGPGDLYLDYDAAVTTSSGLKVPVSGVYEFPRDSPHPLYAVATVANTDVRVLVVG